MANTEIDFENRKNVKLYQEELRELEKQFIIKESEDCFMTVEDYTEACIDFWESSRGWLIYNGDFGKGAEFITTSGAGNWCASCDNAHGGIDVKWAYYEKSIEGVKESAPYHFQEELLYEIKSIHDEFNEETREERAERERIWREWEEKDIAERKKRKLRNKELRAEHKDVKEKAAHYLSERKNYSEGIKVIRCNPLYYTDVSMLLPVEIDVRALDAACKGAKVFRVETNDGKTFCAFKGEDGTLFIGEAGGKSFETIDGKSTVAIRGLPYEKKEEER